MEVQKNKNIGNYYGATPDRPYHLSVGAIIMNDKNEIVCLHYPKIDFLSDIYVVANKTVRTEENLETTLRRVAKVELGCEIDIVTFIGTLVVKDVWWGELGTPMEMEKSILFFLAKAKILNPDWAREECTAQRCEITYKPIDFLIESMQRLQVKDGMRDFDQSKILIRAKEWIKTHPGLTSETL